MTEQIAERRRLTAAEFFALPEPLNPTIIELLDGEIVVTAVAIPAHQRTVFRGASVIDAVKPNGEVFIAPVSVYLDEHNIPEPDIVWVAANGGCVEREKYLEGPPALIVEVLSPSTARYDKTVKFLLYERFRVGEYWIADPKKAQIEVWRLEGEGQGRAYVLDGLYQRDERFTSRALGGAEIIVAHFFV
jgi:Uma2 family endonuclease